VAHGYRRLLVNFMSLCMQVGGTTIDHSTYLVDTGTADIFFPSDFALLQRLYQGAAPQQRGARHMKSKEFFKQHAPDGGGATKTASGYNPLVEDYSNTSFLLS